MQKLLLSCLFAGLAFTSAKAQLQHRHVTPMDSLRTSDAHLAMGKDTTSYFNTGKGDGTKDNSGDTVTLEGIVMFDPGYFGLSTNRKGTWLQVENGNGEWSAVHVLVDPRRYSELTGTTQKLLPEFIEDVQLYDNFTPGLKVKVTGIVDHFQGYTQVILMPLAAEITDLNPNPIAPKVMDLSIFSKSDGVGGQISQLTSGEPFESAYVEFRDVTIVDVAPGDSKRWFWAIQDAAGNKIQIRDASGFFRNDENAEKMPAGHSFKPIEQSKVKYIRGVIFQATVSNISSYFLAPLLNSDLDLVKAPIVNSVSRNPIVVKSTNAVTITANITDDDNPITGATLYYSTDLTNRTYTTVSMASAGNGMYTAQIPAQANNSLVTYFIKATNTPGLSGFSPDSFVTGHQYIVKDNGITSISDLQYDPNMKGISIWNGDTLRNFNLRAVVTAGVGQTDLGFLTIQDGTDPFSGIMIKGQTDVASENIKRGDSVIITSAVVREDFNVIVLNEVKLNVLSSNGTIPAAIKNISIDSIRAGKYNYAEAYESMLLEFNDVFVVETNADRPTNGVFGEWAFDDDTTDLVGLRVDDISNDIMPKNTFATDSLTKNQELDYIRGILYFSFSNWKLLPRNRDDIAGFKTPVDTAGSSINEVERTSFRTYPNPANNYIYVQSQKYFDNANIQLIDVQGKVFSEQAIYGATPVVKISTADLPEGLYLVRISDKSSVQVQKVIIQH